jgi:hypothetical protein
VLKDNEIRVECVKLLLFRRNDIWRARNTDADEMLGWTRVCYDLGLGVSGMYNKKTVFVIGAGGSWHYGYPTGEVLIRKVIEASTLAAKLFELSGSPLVPKFVQQRPDGRPVHGIEQMRRAYQEASVECEQLADKLTQLNPLVIDYFLGHNKSLQAVGRFMIAWVLLECEAQNDKLDHNPNRIWGDKEYKQKHDDDWYRFILHRITYDLKASDQLFANDVHFITFNYDTSLDYHLYRTLHQIELLNGDDVDRFLTDRIIHMYGSVRPAPVQKAVPLDIDFPNLVRNPSLLNRDWGHCKDALDMIFDAAANLKVIDPHSKGDHEAGIVRAQSLIGIAEVIYFLGFGFDQNNCKRLGIQKMDPRNQKPHQVLLTNYRDSGRVNKDATKAFFGVPDIRVIESPTYSYRFDKSTRNVYDAFAMDFGSPEED